MGQYDKAAVLISEIRHSPVASAPRVTAWTMYAEGISYLRDELNISAIDRMRRAYVASRVIGDSNLAALAAAWLTHMHYNHNHYAEMAAWVERCLESLSGESRTARTRLCSTFADANRYLGRYVESDRWYQLARRHAVSEGDEAFLASLMFNRPANGISRLRFDAISGYYDSGLASQLHVELDSALNYSAATGNEAQRYLLLQWKGRLLTLMQDFAGARAPLIEAAANLPEALQHDGMQRALQADIAECEANLGSLAAAADALAKAEGPEPSHVAADDLTVYYGQLAHVMDVLGRQKDAALALQRSSSARELHASEEQALSRVLVIGERYLDR
jgi:hypothetical protein